MKKTIAALMLIAAPVSGQDIDNRPAVWSIERIQLPVVGTRVAVVANNTQEQFSLLCFPDVADDRFTLAVQWNEDEIDDIGNWRYGNAVRVSFSLYQFEHPPVHHEEYWKAYPIGQASSIGVDIDWVRALQDADIFSASANNTGDTSHAMFRLVGHQEILQEMIDECTGS